VPRAGCGVNAEGNGQGTNADRRCFFVARGSAVVRPNEPEQVPDTEEAAREEEGETATSAAHASPPEIRENDGTCLLNAALDFTLTSITCEHPALAGLWIERATLDAFGRSADQKGFGAGDVRSGHAGESLLVDLAIISRP
jgi:hypothetical protein